MKISTGFLMNKKTAIVRIVALILPMIMIVLSITQQAMAKNTYVITDGTRVVIHTTVATDPAMVLNEAGLSLSKDDTFVAQEVEGVSEITVRRIHTVTVNNGGQISEVVTHNETVEELLSRLHIDLSGDVTVSADLDEITTDEMVITITRELEVEETTYEAIPCDITMVPDGSMTVGTEVVLEEGSDGQIAYTYSVHYTNGSETGRTLLNVDIVKEPQNRVVLYGTKPTDGMIAEESGEPVITWFDDESGQITMPSGEVVNFNNYIIVMATAYTCEGWSSPGITASGTIARYGEIAVDPSIIPLGSRLFIRTCDGSYIYGIATAEDTGGLIQGYRIDLYYDTEAECWEFGVRDCEVYFLG